MTGRENRTKNLRTEPELLTPRVESFSTWIVPSQSGDHRSARRSRFAPVRCARGKDEIRLSSRPNRIRWTVKTRRCSC